MSDLSPTKDLSSGLGTVFARIGEFFHIFDLSFFVAGVSTFGALSFLFAHLVYFKLENPKHLPFDSWIWIVGAIVAAYVCGLVSFASGRAISESLLGDFFRNRILDEILLEAITDHDLRRHPKLSHYVVEAEKSSAGTEIRSRKLRRLYIRMWSEVAHSNEAPLFWHHLTRYWAMTATYDAVAFSLGVWAISLLIVALNLSGSSLGYEQCIAGAVISLLASLISFDRGTKYYAYQVEDLAAHFAATNRFN